MSSFARPCRRWRLSQHERCMQQQQCLTSNYYSGLSLLICFLSFAIGFGDCDRVRGLRARGESALGQELDGAVDRYADGAGILIDIAVGAESIFLALASRIGFSAPIRLASW